MTPHPALATGRSLDPGTDAPAVDSLHAQAARMQQRDAARAGAAPPARPLWSAPSAAPARATVPAPAWEPALLALLCVPIDPAEGHERGFAGKEQAIHALLAPLTPAIALQLRRRLEAERAADPLVIAFGGLVRARRERLLAFLAEASRRAARP